MPRDSGAETKEKEGRDKAKAKPAKDKPKEQPAGEEALDLLSEALAACVQTRTPKPFTFLADSFEKIVDGLTPAKKARDMIDRVSVVHPLFMHNVHGAFVLLEEAKGSAGVLGAELLVFLKSLFKHTPQGMLPSVLGCLVKESDDRVSFEEFSNSVAACVVCDDIARQSKMVFMRAAIEAGIPSDALNTDVLLRVDQMVAGLSVPDPSGCRIGVDISKLEKALTRVAVEEVVSLPDTLSAVIQCVLDSKEMPEEGSERGSAVMDFPVLAPMSPISSAMARK